jgi:general secretion pathway protein A
MKVGLISNPHGSRAELLRWVLHALEQPAELNESYVDLFSRFQTFLLSEYAAGRSVVLIFDEAQNLTAEALEELRMFININSGKDEVLQLVLIGQPELRDLVSRRHAPVRAACRGKLSPHRDGPEDRPGPTSHTV